MTPSRLLASLLSNPWGQLSPSIYETGRLVTLAPWLTGHRKRVAFLLKQQHADGSWGGPAAYGLVPTLSATEALLTEIGRSPQALPTLLAAARRGLAAIHRAIDSQSPLPDTPAVEIIVPALVEAVNAHLALPARGSADTRSAALRRIRSTPLPQPSTVDLATAARVRHLIASGAELPEKVLHALEVAGVGARAAAASPVAPGTIGASPAATAAWLGDRLGRRAPAARAYLRASTRPHDGPVASVLPITMFERAWVLDSLLRCGVPVRVPRALTTSIVTAIGPHGTPGGGGLPCDADTTSVTILTAHRLGARLGPDSLRHYETRTHFATWPGERTPSTTTNAHVLECLGEVAHTDDANATWRARAIRKVSRWLREQQSDDGTWDDKWHASPCYATSAAARALHRFGGRAATAAVVRAVEWLLASQQPDGSWGIWGGTPEETAYALHLLVPVLSARVPQGVDRANLVTAAGRGLRYLQDVAAAGPMPVYAPLWHDKDLYTPIAVVHAAILGARYLASAHPEVSVALKSSRNVISIGTRGA